MYEEDFKENTVTLMQHMYYSSSLDIMAAWCSSVTGKTFRMESFCAFKTQLMSLVLGE